MAIDLSKIMFIDIETVPNKAKFADLSDDMAYLWSEKFAKIKTYFSGKEDAEISEEEAFERSAGIYSEFGKIVCISVGFIYLKEKEMFFRTKSFAGDDEIKLLTDFSDLIRKNWSSSAHSFCGHNIKEFDIPYICRRMIINGISIPDILNVAGKKPWETSFIDTLELWKFGDKKNYTSLKLLCSILAVDTPKDDIDGSEVARVYYEENNVERIAIYCQKDVLASAQVFLRLSQFEKIKLENVEHCQPVIS